MAPPVLAAAPVVPVQQPDASAIPYRRVVPVVQAVVAAVLGAGVRQGLTELDLPGELQTPTVPVAAAGLMAVPGLRARTVRLPPVEMALREPATARRTVALAPRERAAVVLALSVLERLPVVLAARDQNGQPTVPVVAAAAARRKAPGLEVLAATAARLGAAAAAAAVRRQEPRVRREPAAMAAWCSHTPSQQPYFANLY